MEKVEANREVNWQATNNNGAGRYPCKNRQGLFQVYIDEDVFIFLITNIKIRHVGPRRPIGAPVGSLKVCVTDRQTNRPSDLEL